MNIVGAVATGVDRTVGWHRLPRPLGMLTLLGLRERLRQRNLYPVGAEEPLSLADPPADSLSARMLDGRWNDRCHPDVGAKGTPFGRNTPPVPEDEARRNLPRPEVVSRALLTRTTFLPAESLNLLAATWVQFEVHDWFAHRRGAPPDSDARNDNGRVAPVKLANQPDPGRPPTFLSDQTHWWDASQLYGVRKDFAEAIRRDGDRGKLKVGSELLQSIEPFLVSTVDSAGNSVSAPVPNLWIGLALFHDLFAREHNDLCDLLHDVYPRWDDEQLYQKARLINAAVMAKIHTVEWTPAVIAHPTTVSAIRATWWGLLGERFKRRYGRISGGELWSGIPGSPSDDDGVDYALTEEFVAVYRMHPLIPDTVTFHRASDDELRTDIGERDRDGTLEFAELAVAPDHLDRPRCVLEKVVGYPDAIYSLAIANPGQITLHNYPGFLQAIPQAGGGTLDLGEVDILRTRECAVARYNDFRRSLRLKPAKSFYELTNDEAKAEELHKLYGNIEELDLMIGLFAEPKPRGFAFSDTAFRVFLLMASRRLRSDRFFTDDYRPETYTPVGLDWIDKATLAGMLRRHHPGLEPALRGVERVFEPWPRVPRRPRQRPPATTPAP